MLGGDSQEGSIGGAEYLTKALKRHGVDAEAHLFPRSRIAMTPWRVRMGRVVSGAARYTRFSGKDCVGLAAGRYAIAFALMAAGVKRNERVLLPAYHCGSMVEPAVWLGADVEFYRLENDLSLDREHLEGLLQRGAKAVVATRYFGFPLGMDGVRELCARYGAVLVEDCAHALYGGGEDSPPGYVGDFAVASTWKFCPGPDGGLVCSNAGPVVWPRVQRPDVGRQLRAVYRVVERALSHVFSGVRKGPRQTVDEHSTEALSAKPLDQAAGPPGEEGAGGMRWFDAKEAGLGSTLMARVMFRRIDFRRSATARRDNYRFLLDRCSELGRARPLYGELPEGVIPYVFPLVLDHPAEDFRRLKYRGVPIWRWDELAVSDCEVTQAYRRSLLQLPCHEDLRLEERTWLAEALRAVLA